MVAVEKRGARSEFFAKVDVQYFHTPNSIYLGYLCMGIFTLTFFSRLDER